MPSCVVSAFASRKMPVAVSTSCAKVYASFLPISTANCSIICANSLTLVCAAAERSSVMVSGAMATVMSETLFLRAASCNLPTVVSPMPRVG